MNSFFDTPIEFLKGVGPNRSELLNKELHIFTFGDLIQYFPFRYEDRTRFFTINELSEDHSNVQIKGFLANISTIGGGRKKRLVARLVDDSGSIELVWFKGVDWVAKKLIPGVEYVVFGKPSKYGSKLNIAHPEIEIATKSHEKVSYLQPVYSTTEKLKNKYLDSKAILKLVANLLEQGIPKVTESLPAYLIEEQNLMGKREAMLQIHFPTDQNQLALAKYRLKFEELFFIQIRLFTMKLQRTEKFKGQIFNNTDLITKFYKEHLPFELTNAQKRVVKEIYKDLKSGSQMNRLLQGDVGSGKTIVAFLCMLLAISSGTQTSMMAPTEILAIQHYNGLKPYVDAMGLRIALLTGSTKQSERKIIHQMLRSGDLNIIVGTHALIEEKVQFKNLGLAVIDEQHRFGVAQRSKLWKKNSAVYPHVLVMTATPIPRTLAMTLYGDLDVSVIDELPAGRKEIKTYHKYDEKRLEIFGFIKKQIQEGRQVYIVYPLIEESEKMDLKHLTDGYESICRAFPDIPISIVHGKMKPDAKDFEMQRFVKGETKIMVATTVIEVGVNVPNATVMIIENAERFGLAQLHQLRGRVGRGADQSYCILMTSFKLSKDGRTRIDTMVRTSNGFEIADVDLNLRGPGDLTGTQQSGIMELSIADLSKDGKIIQLAREVARNIMEDDYHLEDPKNKLIKEHLLRSKKSDVSWSRIS